MLTMQNSSLPGCDKLGNQARDSDSNYMDKCKLTVFWMPLSKYNGDPIKNGHIPYTDNNVKGVMILKRPPWVQKFKIGERRFIHYSVDSAIRNSVGSGRIAQKPAKGARAGHQHSEIATAALWMSSIDQHKS